MDVRFGLDSYELNEYGLPPVELVNWYALPAPDRPDKGARLVPVEGVENAITRPSGFRGRGCASFQNIFTGVIAVETAQVLLFPPSTGNTLGSPATLGSLGGTTGEVDFAASFTEVVVCGSGHATAFAAGPTATAVTLPSGVPQAAAEINQRHLYVQAGTSVIWYSDVADATTIGGSSFFTVEQEPQDVTTLLEYNGVVYAFGVTKITPYVATTSVTTPFVARQGAEIRMGIIGRSAKTIINDDIFFVRTDGAVCRMRAGGYPEVVSTEAIQRLISSDADSDDVVLSGFSFGQRTVLQVHIPNTGDYFYDASLGLWHRRKALTSEFWRYRFYTQFDGLVYCQNAVDLTPHLGYLSNETFTDRGDTLRREATAIVPIMDDEAVDMLVLEGQSGVGLPGAVQGSEPLAMLRVARDGRTFEDELTTSLGLTGEYNWRPTFGPLGYFKPPVAVLKIALSDPIGYTVTGATINPDYV
ncbi:MAG: hypothetical protein AAFR11_05615 [Pseudomonadota bacterium]